MYLFFDTETTGLPRNWNAPTSDSDNWPRLVQLAWELYGQNGERTETGNLIIKPQGFIVPADASRVHGITNDRAYVEGIALTEALERFAAVVHKADYLVAHNIAFDEKIVGAEYLRSDKADILVPKKKICTMLTSVDFCAIEGPRGYKWPKLAELHKKLFNEDFAEAHNAAADINATARCFWELEKLGVIRIEQEKPASIESVEAKQLGLF